MSIKKLTGAIITEPDQSLLIEVVETDVFGEEARRHLSDGDIEEIKYWVASLREVGEIVPGTGGLRKFRWGLDKGKRKGARIIYYYGGDEMPVVLIDIYKKSEKLDISEADKKLIRKLINELRDEYLRSRRRK